MAYAQPCKQHNRHPQLRLQHRRLLLSLQPKSACSSRIAHCRNFLDSCNRLPATRLHSSLACSASRDQQPIGIVLDTDTIAIDTHNDGHRVAFNQAFDDLGLSCASWPPSVYLDLRRSADGTALGMLRIYFETIGWPSLIPKNGHRAFAEQVVQRKDIAFRKLLSDGKIPLRPGVAQLVDDALADGARIALLCGTNSAPEDNVGTAAVFAFGVQRARRMKMVNTWGDAEIGTDADEERSSLEEDLSDLNRASAEAQAKMKQQEAIALTKNMKNVGVDANILASQRRMGSHVMSRAANELGVSAIRCALLAANELTLQAGRGAGMTAVCIPTALAGRYKPPSSQANYDGFGAGGGATWPRIKGLVEKHSR